MENQATRRTVLYWMRRQGLALLPVVAGIVLICFGGRRLLADARGGIRLIVYAFSTQEAVLTQGILPAFQEEWQSGDGSELTIETVFGPSATLAGQINLGAPADVTLFSNAHHVTWLQLGRRVRADAEPVVVGCTPMVIVTRPGNPAGIRDYADLTRPEVRLLHANPESSGAAEWAVLAVYGSALLAERGSATADAVAVDQLQAVWSNVRVMAPSARAMMALFELGAGDAVITYEQDALLAQDRGVELEIVMPPRTIAACHVLTLVDDNITRGERRAAEAFVDFMVGDTGRTILRSYHLRPPGLIDPAFAPTGEVFTADDLGGWAEAHRRLIDDLWQEQIEPRLDLESGPLLVGPGDG
jgi:ABC-type sulfate transport system substrate-binding protein